MTSFLETPQLEAISSVRWLISTLYGKNKKSRLTKERALPDAETQEQFEVEDLWFCHFQLSRETKGWTGYRANVRNCKAN